MSRRVRRDAVRNRLAREGQLLVARAERVAMTDLAAGRRRSSSGRLLDSGTVTGQAARQDFTDCGYDDCDGAVG